MRSQIELAVFAIVIALLLMPGLLAASPAEEGRPASIPTFDKTGVQVRQPVDLLRLHSLDGKSYDLSTAWGDSPALLVLSSISCPVSRDNCAAVDRISRRYAGKINVVVIYTIEAHPVEAPSPYSGREWLTDRNVQDRVLVKQPANIAQRIAVAKQYRELKKIKATLVVDAIDNRAWKHIGPGPNTAILVSRNGYVGFRQGWLAPASMEAAIRWMLTDNHNKVLRKKADTLTESFGFDVPNTLKSNFAKNREKIERVLRRESELVNLMVGTGRGDDPGDTLLHKAAASGDDKKVEFLLQYMPNINQANSVGRTPLHLAAEKGHVSIVRTLLAQHADPNAFDKQGLTPCHLALLAGHRDVVKQLMDGGGAMDIRVAAGLGDMAALKRYVDIYRQTDIYLKTRGGAALSFAAANNQTDVLNRLLDEGVSTTIEVDSHPSFYYAVHHLHHDAAAVLLERKVNSHVALGRYLGGPLHYAALKGDGVLIDLLIKYGADVEKLNLDEETPLHLAAQSGRLKSAKQLLAAGAKINARTGHEAPRPCGPREIDNRPRLDTPLHLAVKSGQVEFVSLLLASKAATHLKNREGYTPLELAVSINKNEPNNDTAKMVKLLTPK